MPKSKSIICLVSLLLLLLCGCGSDDSDNPPRSLIEVSELVLANETVLRQEVEYFEYGAESGVEGVTDSIKEYGPDPVYYFRCDYGGISVSSYESGFYYSPNNTPFNVYVGMDELSEAGEGFSHRSTYEYYTQKICENFYYYDVVD